MARSEFNTAEHNSYTVDQAPTHDAIERRAYELWHDAGRPEGHDLEYWLAAERSLQTPTDVADEVQPAASLDSRMAVDVKPAHRQVRHRDDSSPPASRPRAPRRRSKAM